MCRACHMQIHEALDVTAQTLHQSLILDTVLLQFKTLSVSYFRHYCVTDFGKVSQIRGPQILAVPNL